MKEIKGRNHEGIERTYKFNLLSHKEGVKVVHTYGSIAATAFQYLKDFFQGGVDSVDDKDADKESKPGAKPNKMADVLAIIPQIFTWERMEDLAKRLMAGATVSGDRVLESHEETIDVDGEAVTETIVDKSERFEYKLDDEGFCELFGEDVLEFYLALFYAVVANYPKYLLPFLDTGQNDSTQDS